MEILRDRRAIQLTDAELEAAYREKELQYRMQDAKQHLLEAVYQTVEEKYGRGFEVSLDPEWEEDILQTLVDDFEQEFDCNVSENQIWANVMEQFMRENDAKGGVSPWK